MRGNALLVLGFLLIAGGFLVQAPPESNYTYRYEAVEVTPTTADAPGAEPYAVAGDAAVDDVARLDDQVLCSGIGYRNVCGIVAQVVEGDAGVSRIDSVLDGRFEYVLVDGRFYSLVDRTEEGSPKRIGETPISADLVFEAVSTPAASLTPTERSLIEDGPAITHRELPHEGQLVERGGTYYVVENTGTAYSDDGRTACGYDTEAFGEKYCGDGGTAFEPDFFRYGWTPALVSLLGGVLVLYGERRRIFDG